MEKDGSGDEKDGQNEGDHGEDEPGGAAAVLRAGFGDAEGSEEGIGEGFENSHKLRIRRALGGCGLLAGGTNWGRGRIRSGPSASNEGVRGGLTRGPAG